VKPRKRSFSGVTMPRYVTMQEKLQQLTRQFWEDQMYDPKLLDLAELFLADRPQLKPRVKELAQLLQDTIDDFIDMALEQTDDENG
jgi:hypothetical protein